MLSVIIWCDSASAISLLYLAGGRLGPKLTHRDNVVRLEIRALVRLFNRLLLKFPQILLRQDLSSAIGLSIPFAVIVASICETNFLDSSWTCLLRDGLFLSTRPDTGRDPAARTNSARPFLLFGSLAPNQLLCSVETLKLTKMSYLDDVSAQGRSKHPVATDCECLFFAC